MSNKERAEILMDNAECLGDYRKALDEAEIRGMERAQRICKNKQHAEYKIENYSLSNGADLCSILIGVVVDEMKSGQKPEKIQ